MTTTAVLFVDSKAEFEGGTLASLPITDVPLLKRNVIDLRRAGFKNIVVVMDERTAELEAVLDDVRRTEFSRFSIDDQAWREQVSATGDHNVVVVTSDRLTDFHLLQKLRETPLESNDLAVITVDTKGIDAPSPADRRFHLNDGAFVSHEEFKTSADSRRLGVYVLPVAAAKSVTSVDASELERAAETFEAGDRARLFEIGNGFVETIDSRLAVKRAERRLIRYIWKSTDGMYARRNKRILMPILPFIFKLPITPNMISLVGVIANIYCGYLFSRGGYLFGIAGALVAYASGLLDHVDGAIARIKSKESDFGAHFDTLCDYVFYVAFGVGLTAGLYRSSGNPFYIWLGVAALFGIIFSLILVSYVRNTRVANASAFAAEAHRVLETSSRISYLGRRVYFVVRRPVVPYFIVFFAVVNLLPFILFMTAVSANLFWMFHLYTSRFFSPVPKDLGSSGK